MARVFLSYARNDASHANRLAGLLERAGHQVWFDRELQGGSRFATEIEKALSDAEAVVVLWSTASIASAWVQDEAAEGRDSGRLVPTIIEEIRPPLGFRQYQSIGLQDIGETGGPGRLDELLRAIDSLGRTTSATNASRPVADAPPANAKSICVLPFINMSGDTEQEYFSDGITEDIITDLSNVLSVTARNTAFTFKGRAVDVKDVARSLGVKYILEGSVRKAGSRVRITAQLIDGAKGDHVWAERFDRELTDIFEIQDDIAKSIAKALQLKLLPTENKAVENRGTSSVDAYNLYLMARQQWVDGSFGTIRRDETIARICQQATQIDPNYANAWALMALAQAELRFWHGRADVDAMTAAERALAINPNLAEPHCVVARYREEEGKLEEAKSEIEEALRLSPDSWEVNREAARLVFRLGRLKDSIPLFEKAGSLSESDWHNPSMLMTCYGATGDQVNRDRVGRLALERAERAVNKDPTNGSAIAIGASALAMLGEDDRAREWMQRGMLLDPGNMSMLYNMTCAMIMELDDPEGALDILGSFLDRTDSVAVIRHMMVDPDLDSVRDHPRFRQMFAAAKQRVGID